MFSFPLSVDATCVIWKESGVMASDEMSFENVDGRRTDGRRMPVHTISSPMSFGSGDLKLFSDFSE